MTAKFGKILTITACLTISSQSFTIELVNNWNTQIETPTQYIYYTNLFLSDKVFETPSESIFSLSPSVSINKGDDESIFFAQGTLGVHHYQFLSQSEYNRTDPFIRFTGSYKGDRLQTIGTAENKDIILPSHENRNTIGYSRSKLSFDLNYDITGRMSFASDSNFRYTNYKSENGNDYSQYTLPFRLLYNLSEDLKIGLGHRFRKTDFDGGSNRNDIIWHLSLEGKITQDIELDFRIGHNQSDFIDTQYEDLENIYISGDATWRLTEDSILTAHISNKAGAYSNGQSVERTWIRTSYQWTLTETLQSSMGIAFLNEDFSNTIRTDKLERIEASLVWAPDARRYSGSLGISYENNDSNIFGLDYTNTIINGSFNYTF